MPTTYNVPDPNERKNVTPPHFGDAPDYTGHATTEVEGIDCYLAFQLGQAGRIDLIAPIVSLEKTAVKSARTVHTTRDENQRRFAEYVEFVELNNVQVALDFEEERNRQLTENHPPIADLVVHQTNLFQVRFQRAIIQGTVGDVSFRRRPAPALEHIAASKGVGLEAPKHFRVAMTEKLAVLLFGAMYGTSLAVQSGFLKPSKLGDQWPIALASCAFGVVIIYCMKSAVSESLAKVSEKRVMTGSTDKAPLYFAVTLVGLFMLLDATVTRLGLRAANLLADTVAGGESIEQIATRWMVSFAVGGSLFIWSAISGAKDGVRTAIETLHKSAEHDFNIIEDDRESHFLEALRLRQDVQMVQQFARVEEVLVDEVNRRKEELEEKQVKDEATLVAIAAQFKPIPEDWSFELVERDITVSAAKDRDIKRLDKAKEAAYQALNEHVKGRMPKKSLGERIANWWHGLWNRTATEAA
jgi:hypothetical protein